MLCRIAAHLTSLDSLASFYISSSSPPPVHSALDSTCACLFHNDLSHLHFAA